MPHETALIGTVAIGLGAAFVLGLLAARLRLPPLVGYLVAGIAVGPFTPGPTVDAGLAGQLAELGVILLMFGVGIHFSLRDLAAVRRVVLPGALAQTAITGSVGAALALWWGWGAGGAAVLGLSLGVASTVVLLKGLEGRDRLDSPDGRMAVGWLVVEDILMVLALVLLPALAPMLRGGSGEGPAALLPAVGIAVLKVALFLALMFFVGRRLVPWLLEHVARLGSRELFTLAVLVTALGVGSVAAELFDVSFALGAFFAGAVISESEISARAAADALPMQDAFAVLFFVSVGMLFEPAVLVERPVEIFAIVAVVVLWKSFVAFGLVRLLGETRRTSLLIGASLGQIGEFSFIVAALGVSLGLVSADTQGVIVAAALIAIVVNGPVLSAAVSVTGRMRSTPPTTEMALAHAERMTREMRVTGQGPVPGAAAGAEAIPDLYTCDDMRDHVVLVGFGRVGTTVADAIARSGVPHVVVEEQERIVEGLRERGMRAIGGDATRADVLDRAGILTARLLVVTAPEPIRSRRIIEVARGMNPGITVAVRTHSATEQAFFEETLAGSGAAGLAVYAEREAALSLAHYALRAYGRSDDEADMVVGALRQQPTRPTEMFRVIGTREFRVPEPVARKD